MANRNTEMTRDGDSQVGSDAGMALLPPADIWEGSDRIVLHLDMPGVSKDRLTIRADKESLVVEGQVQIEMPAKMEALYADVGSTRYHRSFVLSPDLDTDAIEAILKDGVLTLQIPKREEVRPRRIAVRTA